MNRLNKAVSVLVLSACATAATATEKPDHFKGKESRTLQEAVVNFAEYNAKLAYIVAKDELSGADMAEVHELTYTIENALAKINEATETMAVDLEEVHLASESADVETVKSRGKKFLESAKILID
ncbi:MAG: hypothetical protein HLUCCX14_05905 [Marinobacter excellens HL-55]|uniref:Uncharacterized protein n=1 Tax=Marinobacter excellens HL-55 TaxID=1305731 RepID=A0A0P7YIJ4_9GAMM|nr:MAG: hypothetical protein HLUCCX14_05905 [Marinobacter excellens HL-55]